MGRAAAAGEFTPPGHANGRAADAAPLRWLAISDAPARRSVIAQAALPPDLLLGPPGALLATGSLVFDLGPGLSERPGTLIELDRQQGWRRHLSLRLSEDGAVLHLAQQQGAAVLDMALPLPAACCGRVGQLRVSYAWDAPRRWSRLCAEQPGVGVVAEAAGRNPPPLPLDDVAALVFAPGLRHPGLDWFAIAEGILPVGQSPGWLGHTPVATPAGPRRADQLGPGDLVLTADSGACRVQQRFSHLLPARGSYAPVRLRAPYFGQSTDLVLAAQQRLALGGAEVEYLFGADEVMIQARHLVNNRSALAEPSRGLVRYASLMLDRPALALADGCLLECPTPAGRGAGTDGPLRPELRSYEAMILLDMRAQGQSPAAA